ncbi:MAG: hypothetical protein V5B34_18275 [Accumulibacter sp.]
MQAAVLLAVLGDRHPGAIEEALRWARLSILGRLKSAARLLRPLLENDHPRAWDELNPE